MVEKLYQGSDVPSKRPLEIPQKGEPMSNKTAKLIFWIGTAISLALFLVLTGNLLPRSLSENYKGSRARGLRDELKA